MMKEKFDALRKIPEQKITPPGTVWLKGNLFIDKTEISNTNWREFMYWNSTHKVSKSYRCSMLPDSTVWGNTYIYANWYSNNEKVKANTHYLRHAAFSDFPVIGISYKQALEFCKWRSDIVNQYLYYKSKKLKCPLDSVKNYPEVVKYRLPTAEEWEYAASAGLDFNKYPAGYESIIDRDNLPVNDTREYALIYRLKQIDNSHIDTSKKKFTKFTNVPIIYTSYKTAMMTSVNTGKPNIFGIYNMLGNVSEIITDSTYKGLNFTQSISNDSSDIYNYRKTFRYSKPEIWLGFRCVCEVNPKYL